MAFRFHDLWQGSPRHLQRIGEEISSTIRWKRTGLSYAKRRASNNDRVRNKPYRFELRDEYTKGPNPGPLLSWETCYAESS